MPRKIWVATTCFRAVSEQPRAVEDNVRRAEELVDLAGAYRPDLICLPETFPSIRVPHQRAEEVAQEVPGPATEALARKARQRRAYVVCPLFERRGDRVYNVAVLLDRDGQIVGTYEKIHPVASQPPLEPGAVLERGVTPGREPKVFETDFGRIGILICFDSNWPEEWAALKRRGAELVVFPSAYEAGFKLFAHAWNNKYYVVSSTWSTPSKIIDLTGQLIATTGTYTDLAVARVDLEKRFFHVDWHAARLAELQRRYGRQVKVQWCLPEAGFALESETDGLTVGHLIEEFGLQPYEEYIAASTELQERLREAWKPRITAGEAEQIIARINVLKEDLDRCKARFPYMDKEIIGQSEAATAEYYRKRGHNTRFVFPKPLTAEDVEINNRITHWLNENLIIRLHAVLESSGVVHGKEPVDNLLAGRDEVELVRRLRNEIGHGSGEYNPKDSRDEALYRALVRVCHLDGGIPTTRRKYPLDINRVLDPLIAGCVRYVRALASPEGEARAFSSPPSHDGM